MINSRYLKFLNPGTLSSLRKHIPFHPLYLEYEEKDVARRESNEKGSRRDDFSAYITGAGKSCRFKLSYLNLLSPFVQSPGR